MNNFIVLTGNDEVIVTTTRLEAKMLLELFEADGMDRDPEDYDRTAYNTDLGGIIISSNMKVQN